MQKNMFSHDAAAFPDDVISHINHFRFQDRNPRFTSADDECVEFPTTNISTAKKANTTVVGCFVFKTL